MKIFPDGLDHEVLRSQWLGWTESLQAQIFLDKQCLREQNLLGLSKWLRKPTRYSVFLVCECVCFLCVSENLHVFK